MSKYMYWVKKDLFGCFRMRRPWQRQWNRFERGRRNRNVNLQCFYCIYLPLNNSLLPKTVIKSGKVRMLNGSVSTRFFFKANSPSWMLISVSAASVVVRLSHSSKFISVESIVFAIELEGDLVVDCFNNV